MDLTTTYLGLTLKNPIVPGASPLTQRVGGVQRLAEAGAAAVVLPSIFEEQIDQESRLLDRYLAGGADSYAESLSYFPERSEYRFSTDEYLSLIDRCKQAVDIPIIASLNGVSAGGWVDFARSIEQAGADALELNVYYLPTDPGLSGSEVEAMYVDDLRRVKLSVSLPVAVKLSPYFSATANMALRLTQAGADGLVLFNRFYQPDFDLEALEVVPNLTLSTSWELRLPLRWVAILFGQVAVDFAITSGVHEASDVLKSMMAGARVTMLVSELLRRGPERIGEILHELTGWLEAHEYESLRQLQGSMSQQRVADPAAFERANYMRMLQAWRPEPFLPYR